MNRPYSSSTVQRSKLFKRCLTNTTPPRYSNTTHGNSEENKNLTEKLHWQHGGRITKQTFGYNSSSILSNTTSIKLKTRPNLLNTAPINTTREIANNIPRKLPSSNFTSKRVSTANPESKYRLGENNINNISNINNINNIYEGPRSKSVSEMVRSKDGEIHYRSISKEGLENPRVNMDTKLYGSTFSPYGKESYKISGMRAMYSDSPSTEILPISSRIEERPPLKNSNVFQFTEAVLGGSLGGAESRESRHGGEYGDGRPEGSSAVKEHFRTMTPDGQRVPICEFGRPRSQLHYSMRQIAQYRKSTSPLTLTSRPPLRPHRPQTLHDDPQPTYLPPKTTYRKLLYKNKQLTLKRNQKERMELYTKFQNLNQKVFEKEKEKEEREEKMKKMKSIAASMVEELEGEDTEIQGIKEKKVEDQIKLLKPGKRILGSRLIRKESIPTEETVYLKQLTQKYVKVKRYIRRAKNATELGLKNQITQGKPQLLQKNMPFYKRSFKKSTASRKSTKDI